LAGRAGALDREEALLGAHLAHAGAGGAALRLRAALGAGALALAALDRARHGDRRLLAGIGVFQRDGEVVAQIGAAARGAAPATAAAHEIAEKILEHVREGAAEIGLAATHAAGP